MGRRFLPLLALASMLASPVLTDAVQAKDRSDDGALEALADQVTITPAQAVKAAKARKQGRVTELCLEARGGKPVYKVEFEDDREVYVDARSGQVIDRPAR
jgi:uncharacterized membrane protein YkoI